MDAASVNGAPWWRTIAVALVAALAGALVTMAGDDLRVGESIGAVNSRLASISVRLTAVESQLSRITCVEARGTNTCNQGNGGGD